MIEESIFDKELYELDPQQATEILHQFLANERVVFRTLKLDEVELDYSKESVIKLFEYVIANIFDAKNPKSEVNSVWVCRLAYYFGESLKKYSDRLDWGIGEHDTAFENHPVIKGFAGGLEAALITISKVLLKAVAVDGQPHKRMERAVDYWFDRARASN